MNISFRGFFSALALSVVILIGASTDAQAVDKELSQLSELHGVISRLFPGDVIEIRRFSETGRPYLWLERALDAAGVSIELLDDERPNAFAIPAYRSSSGSARIVLTTGLRRVLMSKSELAFVVAHELAHLRADHFSPELPAITLSSSQIEKIVSVHQSWEIDADRSAVEMLHRRGLDARAGLHLLGRLDEFERRSESAIEHKHPPISERLNRLNSQLAQILP